jgi:hypothetical protein
MRSTYRRTLFTLLVAGVVVATAAGPARGVAISFNERDFGVTTGSLPSAALAVGTLSGPAGLIHITGDTVRGFSADMYAFSLARMEGPVTKSFVFASAVQDPLGPFSDPQLFLFDASGRGIAANDEQFISHTRIAMSRA